MKKWTGERLETFIFNSNTVEHLHRYALALEYVKGKDVLDIACGEGYGTNLLANNASFVTGVDIDKETVENAKSKYVKKNIRFLEGKAQLIPLEDNSVDVVVSFETIEHHDKHVEMMNEIKRVLRKDGVLIMSSPDKKYYSDNNEHKNSFHVKELYFDEFKQLIRQFFVNSQFISQTIFCGSLFLAEPNFSVSNVYTGDFSSVKNTGDLNGVYNICIASDSELEPVRVSFFDGWKILNSQSEYRSFTYKVGDFVLFPAKLVMKIIKKVLR